MKSSNDAQDEDLHSLNSTLYSKLDKQAKYIASVYHAVKDLHAQDNENKLKGIYTCGGTEGWRRVVYLDMTNPSAMCPSGWNLTSFSKRTCGRSSGANCDPVTFQTSGGEYSKVCGRARGYQFGSTLAFYLWPHINVGYRVPTIDEAYVTGLSITHGTPREHIWTYAVGLREWQYGIGVSNCPCETTDFAHLQSLIPSFVGSDYICESGLNLNDPAELRQQSYFSPRFYSTDPLWDGKNCIPACCSYNNPPYFIKQLPETTHDEIEVRICNYHSAAHSNVPIELLELYVQ